MQQKENRGKLVKSSLESLKKQFRIVKASEEYDDEKKSTLGNRASQGNVRTSQGSQCKINDEDYQNYLVKVDGKREFNDLGEIEYQPVLDLIFHS